MSARAVIVAHREALAAEGIAAALDRYPALLPIGVATSATELLSFSTGADMAAVDARIPGAVGAARKLLKQGLRVVMIGDEPATGDPADEGGIFVSLGAGVASLAAALVPGAAAGGSLSTRLTDRERQILRLVAKGFAGKQIARLLGISPKTVEQHKTRTFRKLGVPNQAAAVALLADEGAA